MAMYCSMSWICKVELCHVSSAVSGFCHKCCQSHKSLFGSDTLLHCFVLFFCYLPALSTILFFLLHSWLLTLQTGIQFHYNFATSTQHICNNNRKKTIKRIEGNCSVMIFCQLHFLFMILYLTFRYVFTVFRVIHSKLCSTCVFERILETKRTTNNRGERSPNWDLFWHPLFIFSHQD